tara:strand:+ start:758 stop:1558 length:801 start_codon:yes stop_codon:yes gene_type:complete
MSNYVEYRDGADTSASPSPGVWADCPAREFLEKGTGVLIHDDFIRVTSDNVATVDSGLQLLGDNIPTMPVDTIEGRLTLTTGATDNHQSFAGTNVDLCHISDAAGETAKLWFECRMKVNSVADMGLFIGLAAEADFAVDFLVDDTADLASGADAIGFHVLTASPTAVGVTYQEDGSTKQALETGVHTLVADTYVKLGFVYDPDESDANKIKFYVNGAKTATNVTAAMIAASTFPDSKNLGFVATNKTGEGVTKTMNVDWYRLAYAR